MCVCINILVNSVCATCWFACVHILICMCPHADSHVSTCWLTCVHMLICMCPYADLHVSICWFACVRMLISMCPNADFSLCDVWRGKKLAQEENHEALLQSFITERTFFSAEKWQQVRPPQKIPRSRGLQNGDNVYVLQTEKSGVSVNGFCPHVGVVLDANLKKGIKCIFPDSKDPEFVSRKYLRLAPITGM